MEAKNFSVYIRPLKIEDADISYKWRNNPAIWKYTGRKPDKYITPEIEKEWLANALNKENEKRFAMCLKSDDTYIGNIFFTHITEDEAQIHIFIGEMDYMGGGRAYQAVCLLINYGFEQLNLQRIIAHINKLNIASKGVARALGFKQVREFYNEESKINLTEFIFTREQYNQNVHLNSVVANKYNLK